MQRDGIDRDYHDQAADAEHFRGRALRRSLVTGGEASVTVLIARLPTEPMCAGSKGAVTEEIQNYLRRGDSHCRFHRSKMYDDETNIIEEFQFDLK
ncbi:hypothetical protein NDK50_12525 [Paraburkholderia bryophila]|uniref:hypothetical protein n=1 Tax=Paraburkholderia bryophila TaxID=420952 RepID=UPI00234B0017|nr:hypothetical protein [Paraburkholderia bryophila]WCM18293.1 hypothetical protein NDK50_12525 [Paraburkholderia bryophila]